MARKKKTKAAPQRNLSLRERLAGHWESGKWENFAALYLRDREASERTPWAGRLGDALYNCLTKALFVQKNLAAALEFANLLRDEAAADPDAGVLGDCARVALDFLEARNDPAARPSLLTGREALPPPYARLRFSLSAPPPKAAGRAPKGPAAKLSAHFAALSRGGGLTPYTNFFKTALELEKMTAGSPSAGLFRAVRAIASLLRELQKKRLSRDDQLRDVDILAESPEFLAVKAVPAHPAILGLWSFFCDRGEAKFGRDWAAAARVMPLMCPGGFRPELSASFKFLLSGAAADRPKLFWALAAERSAWPWSEPERFLLASFCLLKQAGSEIEIITPHDDPAPLAVRWLETVTEIGRARRPDSPWPPLVVQAFEALLLYRNKALCGYLDELDLPYGHLTAPSLAYLIVREPALREPIRRALQDRRRWPLAFTREQIAATADEMALNAPVPSAVRNLQEAVSPENYAAIIESWVETAVESSAIRVADGSSAFLPWDDLSDRLGDVIENLPADSPALAFCRLAQKGGRRDLPEEPGMLETLFEGLSRMAARSDSYAFSGNLFILLTAWPKISAATMVRLFDLARPFFLKTGLWRKAAEAVSQIPQAARRKSLADGVAKLLRKYSGRRSRSDWAAALELFEAMKNGRPLPCDYDLEDFDDDLFKMMTKIFEKSSPRRGKKK